MANNLTTSQVDRQNLLNNTQVIIETQKNLQLQSIEFLGEEYVTKGMAARFYDVDIRTIDRYLAENENELRENGYKILKGIELGRFLQTAIKVPGSGITRENIHSITQLGVFNFRAFLNLGMILVESENARMLRKMMLDIVMDFINMRTGGSTKYVNQRDRHFLDAYLQEYNYRREFTDALDSYVDMSNVKYGIFTNMVYKSIFLEKAREYKQVLQLKKNDRIRDTLYSEILNLISAFEHGFAGVLQTEFEKLGRKLDQWEAFEAFKLFEQQPLWEPLLNQARSKMASRDLAFRDAFHEKLCKYIRPVSSEEFENFFGAESEEVEKVTSEHREKLAKLADCDILFERLLEENADVLKRLKERE